MLSAHSHTFALTCLFAGIALSVSPLLKSSPQQRNRRELMKLLEDLQHARALYSSLLQGPKNDLTPNKPSHTFTAEDYSDPLAGLISDDNRAYERGHQARRKEDRPQKAYEKSTQAAACSLGHIINRNCIQAARTLHGHPLLHSAHPYLHKVLQEALGRTQRTEMSPLAQELVNNEQFYAQLRQKAQSTSGNGKKDPTLVGIKELSKHLHYYTWFQAARLSHHSLSQSCSRYRESAKDLPENLQLIISSMLNEKMC